MTSKLRTIRQTTKFKRDLKRMVIKKHYSKEKLVAAVHAIFVDDRETLQSKYHDHSLAGQLRGYRELHIEPDWLLMYFIHDKELVLSLARTGKHQDLF